jgi:hypothetical protein
VRHAAGLLLLFLLPGCERRPSKTEILVARLETMNNLRNIAALIITSWKELPIEDGALDVYAIVRKGDVDRANYSIFRKKPLPHPTDEEIESCDYTHFPYHRYRGSGEIARST